MWRQPAPYVLGRTIAIRGPDARDEHIDSVYLRFPVLEAHEGLWSLRPTRLLALSTRRVSTQSFGWQTFKRIGASLTMSRAYRFILIFSIVIHQLPL